MSIAKNEWYTIKYGDTLSKIAKEAGISDWRIIYNDPKNEEFRKKRPNPDKIYPGDEIWIPDPSRVRTSTGKSTVFVAKSLLSISIIQIEADSDIPVSYEKNIVTKPHWKLGESFEDTYLMESVQFDCSQRPIVFSLKNRSARLKVKLKIDKLEEQGEYKLKGTLEGLTCEGTFKGEVGEKEVFVEVLNFPTSLQWYKGDMEWEIWSVNLSSHKKISSTRMEVFFIFDKPTSLYLTKGVRVELLRFLFVKSGINGVDNSEKAAVKITEYLHSKHGLIYDTKYGAPSYTKGLDISTNKIDEFKLMFFIEKKLGNIVNCYDMASAVQALCAALGIETEWLFCLPFGFIKTTNIVGVGLCNNPFLIQIIVLKLYLTMILDALLLEIMLLLN